MDFVLEALGEIAAQIFDLVAHLLNLDVDIVFVDTTSTYFEVDAADELSDLQPEPEPTTAPRTGRERGASVRQVQGSPRRPAPGGDRDGGHPRRNPGVLLDLSRQHPGSED